MRRATLWLADNVAFISLMWVGIELNHQGVRNLWVFWIWFKFAASFCAHTDVAKDEYIAKDKPAVPYWLNNTVDFAVVAFLAYHGEYLYATLYTIHYFNLSVLQTALKRTLKKG